ncbi:MAG: ribose-phosphate diphosphokinase [Chloroflexi bacterium]|nr:ribose-phosphate diphosphokinase [Chloroflexota bacterium]
MTTRESLDDLYIFSGQSNIPLVQNVVDYLGVPLRPTLYDRFSNDNLWIQLGESVRGKDVYIVQSLTVPVQDHLLQMLMMLDIAKTGDADRVTAVIPYYSYGRSDKKDAPRICITARLVADLITQAGADRIITMGLHSDQVHGFFTTPLDHLTSFPVLSAYFKQKDLSDTILVSPDVGYAKHSSKLARLLDLPLAIGTKFRVADTDVVIDDILGGRYARRAIVIDDEIATGGTMVRVCERLHESYGIEEFILACTHGLFSGNAVERMNNMENLTEVVTTDTVLAPHAYENIKKLHVETIAPVLGEAIRCNHLGQSVGDLFAFWSETAQA